MCRTNLNHKQIFLIFDFSILLKEITKQFLVVKEHFGETKVSDLYVKAIVQENVFGFQVPVNDTVRVYVIDAFEYLSVINSILRKYMTYAVYLMKTDRMMYLVFFSDNVTTEVK